MLHHIITHLGRAFDVLLVLAFVLPILRLVPSPPPWDTCVVETNAGKAAVAVFVVADSSKRRRAPQRRRDGNARRRVEQKNEARPSTSSARRATDAAVARRRRARAILFSHSFARARARRVGAARARGRETTMRARSVRGQFRLVPSSDDGANSRVPAASKGASAASRACAACGSTRTHHHMADHCAHCRDRASPRPSQQTKE